DVAPQVLLRPVRERVDLPDVPLSVSLELGGRRAGRRLLAPDPRDPRLDAGQRPPERLDLRVAAAPIDGPGRGGAARVEHFDLDPKTLLEALPGHERLFKQDARVDHEHVRARMD